MTTEEKFHANVTDLMTEIKDMIDNMISEDATDISTTQVKGIIRLLASVKKDRLLTKFIDKREHWNLIPGRDIRSLLSLLPIVFEGSGVDTNIVSAPVIYYINNQDNNIIDKENIDIIWDYLDSFVKLACDKIEDVRKQDAKYCEEIDVASMRKLCARD